MSRKTWGCAWILGLAIMAAPMLLTAAPAGAGKAPDAAAQARQDELQRVGLVRFTSQDYKPGLIRHMVMFRYKPGTSDAVRRQIREQFLAMQQTARRNGKPYILSIETGLQNSGEGADQGLQEAFLLTFRSEGDRNYYVGTPVVNSPAYYEPTHERFKQFAFPHIQSAVVFDYTRSAARPIITVP